jgi:chromosome segregation ATPase
MSLVPAAHQVEQEVAELEDEVVRAQSQLQQVERRARTMAVEADAARDPAQFRAALLGRQLRPGSVAGVVGFFIGLASGAWVITALSWLLR